MRAYSQSHMGKPLAIVLDGKLVSAPIIQSEISRHIQITGEFGESEASGFVSSFRASQAPLPRALEVSSQDRVPYSSWAYRRALHLGLWVLAFMLFAAIFYWVGRSPAAQPASR